DIDGDHAANIACASTFHFQRMFHILMGVTVAEYVRKRRLTLAAQELASTGAKVIDVALKYGYDTPESFNKAFRRAHGITPSEARRSETRLKVYPKLSFHITLTGDKDMDYKIVEKPAFKVAGKGLRVSTKDNEQMRSIPAFWQAAGADGTIDGVLKAMSDGITNRAMIGMCTEFAMDIQEFTYDIGVETGDASS